MITITDLYTTGAPATTASYTSTGTPGYKSIVMLGAHRFYLLFKAREVSLVNSGLTSVQILSLNLPNNDIDFTIGPDLLDPYRPGFAVLLSSKKAFVYKMREDNCLSRNSLGVCVQCPAGKYFSSQDPNNYCLTQAQFLTGYGLEISTSTMKRCTSVGCADCKSDNT